MKHIRLFAVAMAMIVAFSMAALPASALEFTNGEKIDGLGTIEVSTTEKGVAGIEGFDYNETTFKDITKKGQTMYAMEFNPATTGLVAMAYQSKPAYGVRVADAVAAAKAEGYDVVGAINGEFFSMNTQNYGMLTGRLITNGRIIVDSEDCDQVCLAIDSNGGFNLVKSKTQYTVKIDGNPVNGGKGMISKINGRFVGENWWDPWMYFDYKTGGKTYTNEKVKGVEVVFDKVDGTELIVEGTLKGKVVAVNTDAYATEMTENQFVLYAQSTSANYAKLAALTVGQEIEIFADEMNKDAEAVMKNAMTVSAATYPIVKDGENNIANINDEGGLVAAASQRTFIGVKEDGTIVMMCSAGRGKSADFTLGLTLEKAAKMFIALGCKHVVALDGGGSSNMWVDGETKFCTDENGYIRPVGSSILVCKRNAALSDADAKDALKGAIDKAVAAETPVTEAKQAALKAAIESAQAVYNNVNSVTGDYVREAMNIQAVLAMDDTPEAVTTTTAAQDDNQTTTTVKKQDNSQNSPNTADENTVLLYLAIAALALVTVLSVSALQKKATR